MNDYLFGKGYDIIESDLGERILQWMKLHPSHSRDARYPYQAAGGGRDDGARVRYGKKAIPTRPI